MAIPDRNQKIESLLSSWGERTSIMGILNITPDSFSGDGLLTEPNTEYKTDIAQESRIVSAINQAREFVSAGVDQVQNQYQ